MCPWGEILPAPKSVTIFPLTLARQGFSQSVHVVGYYASIQARCGFFYLPCDGIPSMLPMHRNTDGEQELIPKPGPECQQQYMAVLSSLSAPHLSCCTLVCLGDLGPSPGTDLGHNFSYYLQTSCFNAYYGSIPLIFFFFLNCFEFVQFKALFSGDMDGNIRSQHCEHKSCFLVCLL